MRRIPDIVSWAESSAGFYLPETRAPIRLADHQKVILRHVLSINGDGRMPYDTVVYSTPKKSGKTTLGAMVAEYFALFIEPPNELFILANSLEQSQGRAFKSLSRSVSLNRHLKKRTDLLAKSIRFDNGTDVMALSSDYATAAGSNHGLTIWDELWAYLSENSRRLYDELTPVPTRKISMRLVTTYAGYTGESKLLEELFDVGKNGEVVPELAQIKNGVGKPACTRNGRTFVYWDHELKPHPGLSVSPEDYHAEQKKTLRPLAYLRLHENRFTSNESAFVTPDQWEACYSLDVRPLELGDERRLVLGADASTSRDLTALVGVWRNPKTSTRDIVYCRAWKPTRSEFRKGKPTIDLDETIKTEIIKLREAGHVECVYYDPYQLHSIALELEKAGVKMIELPQTSARVEADQAFFDAIIGKTLRHFNHPDMDAHMGNAVAVETPRGFRLDKTKTSRKIDLAVAASMAHYGALKTYINPTELIAFAG